MNTKTTLNDLLKSADRLAPISPLLRELAAAVRESQQLLAAQAQAIEIIDTAAKSALGRMHSDLEAARHQVATTRMRYELRLDDERKRRTRHLAEQAAKAEAFIDSVKERHPEDAGRFWLELEGRRLKAAKLAAAAAGKPELEPKAPQLTMLTYLTAVQDHGIFAPERLQEAGHHPKQILAKAEKAGRKGYADSGVSAWRSWLETAGHNFISTHAGIEARRQISLLDVRAAPARLNDMVAAGRLSTTTEEKEAA